MIELKLLERGFILRGGSMAWLSSSSIGAMGCETLRKNEGVANSFFELLGVPISSSSRFRLPGVVMKESRK